MDANGDYTSTRLIAQNEAVNLVFNRKTQCNPEITVSLMAAAGKSPEVLVTLTSDIGKILSALYSIQFNGKSDFLTSIQKRMDTKYYTYDVDQKMMSAVLGSLTGVDANDGRIQKILDYMKDKNKKNGLAWCIDMHILFTPT